MTDPKQTVPVKFPDGTVRDIESVLVETCWGEMVPDYWPVDMDGYVMEYGYNGFVARWVGNYDATDAATRAATDDATRAATNAAAGSPAGSTNRLPSSRN